ncbi:hypothetical protein SCUP234_09199 [Seiridium cupressi]
MNGVILLLVIAARGVLAGHGMFEPKIGAARSAIFSNGAALDTSITTNGTIDPFAKRGQGKRWVVVDDSTSSSSGGISLWPDKTIKYCYEDVTARGKLYDLVLEAMRVWYSAGLDNSFKMVEVSDSDCTNKRSSVLLISYDPPKAEGGKGTLSTTPAMPNGQPPSCVLSDDATIGMKSAVSNIAHELGHAWGMYHEHQNPYFWPTSYKGKGGTTFSAINWVCENLVDYEDTITKINDAIAGYPSGADLGEIVWGGNRDDICRKRDIAAQWGFSAQDYLPLTSTDVYKVGTQDEDQIDWLSIMIYPTGAGAKTDSSGNRLPTLTKPDGDEIAPNLWPSTKDVQGLMALYGADSDFDETLLNDSDSPSNPKFLTVRGNDIGSCTS